LQINVIIIAAIQIAYKAIYRHGPQITVSRQEACDLRLYVSNVNQVLTNLVKDTTDAVAAKKRESPPPVKKYLAALFGSPPMGVRISDLRPRFSPRRMPVVNAIR
jgi:hypothetical protein